MRVIESTKKWWKNLEPITERIIIFSLIFSVVVMASILIYKYSEHKRNIQNNNNRTLYELVGYNRNVEVLLSKSVITSTPGQSTHILADIWRQADLAKQNLDNLPLPQESIQDVSSYLSQTSDFSYSVMRQTINNNKITPEQYDTLKQLHDYSLKIDDVLTEIYNQSNQGNLNWNKLERESKKGLDNAVPVSTSGLQDLSKTMQDYQGLIYDGAFSNHVSSLEPKILTDNVVDVETAKQNMLKYLDQSKIEKIDYTGESEGLIATYSFKLKYKDDKNEINVDMTKQDGLLLWMVYDRDVSEKKLEVEACKKIAVAYLEKMGIVNMKDTYYTIQQNMITINLAYMQDDVICYPDLIKVKIAMDNGEVCGIETRGYIYNHTNRIINDANISIEDARAIINPNVEVKSQRTAIIPLDGGTEILTYEFQGFADDRNFLIYINAKTGIEEKILLVVDNQNGVLTM